MIEKRETRIPSWEDCVVGIADQENDPPFP